MIVKNEGARIARALRSSLPWVDAFVVCDTGSTDDTKAAIIKAAEPYTHLKQGHIVDVPWIDFGHNRTQALELARPLADYTLMLDADMELQAEKEWRGQITYGDAYDLRYAGTLDYVNTRLFSNLLAWRYLGSTHEYPFSAEAQILPVELKDVLLLDHCDGANRADKFARDILLLSAELNDDPTNARAMFYLAQSYRDLGRPHEALHWYTRRANAPGWNEETWYATYQRACMMEETEVPLDQVQVAYLAAYRMRPQRIEPIYRLVRLLTREGERNLATLYAAIWRAGFAYPVADRLFIDAPVYQGLMDEAVQEAGRYAAKR